MSQASASDLSEAQRQVVTESGHVLCCAVPGSGKTRVLVAKAAYLLRTFPSAHIVLTTFTREAAEEIRDRLRKQVSPDMLRRLTVGTIHSLARSQLKIAGIAPRILSEVECQHLLRRAMEDTGVSFPIEDAVSDVENCKVDPLFAETHPDAAKLTHRYQAFLTEQDAGDFTDMMLTCVQAMEAGRIRPIRATHVLVDEAQDLCAVQYRWLYQYVGAGAVVALVGDDDQSCYGFRRSLGFKGMMDFVKKTGAAVINLDVNYRSTGRILVAADRLISHNFDRVPKKLRGVRGEGAEPSLIRVKNGEKQVEHLVDAIIALCERNPLPSSNIGQYSYRVAVRKHQVAVLARTNVSMRSIEDALREFRIPYVRVGRSIWDDKILQVYVAILTSVGNMDSVGLEVGLRWAGISDTQIRQITSDGDCPMWSMLKDRGPIVKAGVMVGEFITMGRQWASRIQTGDEDDVEKCIVGVAHWMDRVLTGFCGISLADEMEGKTGSGTHADFKHRWKLEAAKEALLATRGTLQGRLIMVRKEGDEGLPRVTLGTFHGSKGREWEHVFLVDVYQGLVPKCGPEASDDRLEEERRIFYVAMTRARDGLTIYTRNIDPLVSEFLHDAGLIH